ncbi:hypothetical protein Baya_5598 [Bagarius yarrelli]|uniref:Uncharacterized protein n=1 Tax=Bagarius yarrelli TaxID=175774 RepID=A0A556TW44_BAGYA|nr:hypothetical protein Baya_5598 [Bagarius yarrelli]
MSALSASQEEERRHPLHVLSYHIRIPVVDRLAVSRLTPSSKHRGCVQQAEITAQCILGQVSAGEAFYLAIYSRISHPESQHKAPVSLKSPNDTHSTEELAGVMGSEAETDETCCAWIVGTVCYSWLLSKAALTELLMGRLGQVQVHTGLGPVAFTASATHHL